MRVRWFGEPWPSAETRAPICEDDDYKTDTPVGQICLSCSGSVDAEDRGIIMPCTPDIDGVFFLEVEGTERSVGAYHIDCWIGEVVPMHRDVVPRKASRT